MCFKKKYRKIDRTLINSLTSSAELWNRWIRLSCYYN